MSNPQDKKGFRSGEVNTAVPFLTLLVTSFYNATFSTQNLYLVTPPSTVRVHKLIVTQLVKESSAFYGTLMFITEFTTARHWSLC